MNKKVIIVGAGGHAQVIKEIIELNNDIVLGFLDDKHTGRDILGTSADIMKLHKQDSEIYFIIAIGNNKIRSNIYNMNNVKYYTAIHPQSIISKSAKIGDGSAIMAGVIINANSTIGLNCIVNTNSLVEHDCTIKDGAHLSYGVILGAECKIGKEAYINAGAIINRNIEIEDFRTIEIGETVKGDK